MLRTSRLAALRPLSIALAAGTLGVLSIVRLPAQTPNAAAQAPAGGRAEGKPTLTEADYARFESVGGVTLSPDGKWVAYTISRGGRGGGRGGAGGRGEFHYRSLTNDADKTIAGASAPTFTGNNRWMLYTQAADAAVGGSSGNAGGRGTGGRGGGGGAGRAGGRGGPPADATAATPAAVVHPGVGVLDLATGASSVMRDIESYVVANDGQHVAMRHFQAAGARGRGADLVIRDLATGADVTLGNVAEFGWSDDASTLAMIVDVGGGTGNGVQVYNIANGTIKSLDAGDTPYSGIRWRAKSADLAVMRAMADTVYADSAYTIVAWNNATSPQPAKHVYDFATDTRFPKEMRVVSYRGLQWSKDGSTIFFGIAPRIVKETPAGRGAGGNPAKVEVWHWTDRREWHAQAGGANQDRTRNYLTAWRIGENALVRLADDKLPNVNLSQSQTVALGSDEDPYLMDAIASGRNKRDVYTVDVATGKRTKVLSGATTQPQMSPSGRYLVYTESDAKTGNWFVMDLTTGSKTSITSGIKTAFVNMEDDHPVSTRRGYGVAGWLTGEKSLVLYDRFDLWQVNIDGSSPKRLTNGREDSTVYRADWTGNDDETIDPAKTILLTAAGEYNKKDGYAHLQIGQAVHRAYFVDKSVAQLIKAKNADMYAFTTQSFSESPQLNVSPVAFSEPKAITHTNAWLSDYSWGKQTLMNYTNKKGDKLQMMLAYPADYQPGKKYPMVVYYYETLTNTFHSFVVPSANATYNTTVFSQAGYFVLRPDIRFSARDPGYSGLDCVVSAVKTAEAAVADIDAKHVGNFGHSWGGYQSAFYAVHNPGIFAASIAGAPLTDLISMYGYTNPQGGAETGHFETGQERMQVSLWEDPAAYIRNSTVFQTDSLKTPLLLEEGDADNNVNFYQSMELFNFGRRLGKQVVFLVYQGELHSPAGDAATDYHKRQLEWFGYWLKGEPAPDWILHGESYLTRQKILDAANPPAAAATDAAGARGAGGRGAGGAGGRGGRGGRGG